MRIGERGHPSAPFLVVAGVAHAWPVTGVTDDPQLARTRSFSFPSTPCLLRSASSISRCSRSTSSCVFHLPAQLLDVEPALLLRRRLGRCCLPRLPLGLGPRLRRGRGASRPTASPPAARAQLATHGISAGRSRASAVARTLRSFELACSTVSTSRKSRSWSSFNVSRKKWTASFQMFSARFADPRDDEHLRPEQLVALERIEVVAPPLRPVAPRQVQPARLAEVLMRAPELVEDCPRLLRVGDGLGAAIPPDEVPGAVPPRQEREREVGEREIVHHVTRLQLLDLWNQPPPSTSSACLYPISVSARYLSTPP